MGTHSKPQFFLVTSQGLCATRWLSFVLASRRDVFVSHGKHPLDSIISGDFLKEKRKGDVESFTRGNELKDFYVRKSLREIFDAYRAVMPDAKAYGNVHAYTIEVLMKTVKSEEELAGINILNVIRHPVSYIDSHYSLVRSAEDYPQLYQHYKEVMFKQAMERFPELALLGDINSKEFLAFAVSCLSVCNQAQDFAYPQFRHVQMEKITTDVVLLQEFCETLTGLEYSKGELENFIKGGPVNRHRGRLSSTDPHEIYASWATWQQDLAHMMIPTEVMDKFEENGYDVSMLRIEGKGPNRRKGLSLDGRLYSRDSLISSILSLLRSGRTEEAVFRLYWLVANYPDSADIHRLLGEGLCQAGQLDKAAQMFDRAIALDPHHTAAYIGLAKVLWAKGKGEEAIHLLQRAASMTPESAEVILLLGMRLLQKGDLEGSITQFEKLTKLIPDDPNAHIKLGEALYEVGRLEAAEAAFLRAYELSPNIAEVHNDLAVLYWEHGDPQKAVEHMQRAVELDPQKPDVMLNCARMLEAMGKTGEAIQLLERYSAANENDEIQRELERIRGISRGGRLDYGG